MNKEALKLVKVEQIDENSKKFIAPEISEGDAFDVFRFKLENYEGPLDLLLDLIHTAQIEIKDIFVSEITEQYLAVMRSWEFLDMDMASEFITVAAELLQQKSWELLEHDEDGEEEEYDPELDIKKRLMEYQLFKEASDKLKPLETINRFYREPEYTEDDSRIVINNFNFDKLIDAFAHIMHKVQASVNVANETTKEIVLDRFTVADKILYISDLVKKQEKISFFSLFEEDYTKSEAINTFLAVLELLKKQVIEADQQELFGDITITYKGEEEEDLGELGTDY